VKINSPTEKVAYGERMLIVLFFKYKSASAATLWTPENLGASSNVMKGETTSDETRPVLALYEDLKVKVF
jgi:hypothetical protein